MADGKPGRGSDQFPLRLPDGMRDGLKELAAFNKRSMNAEIVARLEDYEAIRGEDIKWLKKEMQRLRDERDEALNKARAQAASSLGPVLEQGLPAGLFARIAKAADAHGRQVEEEVVQALEVAFPLPDADELIGIWSAILETLETFQAPSSLVQSDEREAMMSDIRGMIAFFKQEKAAGRGGDLKRRYHEHLGSAETGKIGPSQS